MRIVRRAEFMRLPAGTAFQKGKRWYWGGLCFKTDDVYSNDWRYVTVDDVDADDSGEAFERLEEMLSAGTSYPMADASTRDGCFDDEDLFLIYDAEDLTKIEEMFASAIVVPTVKESTLEGDR